MRRIPLFVSALVGLAAAVTAPAAQAQNAAAGAATFKQQCQMCHVNTAGAKGFAAPNLWGVVGPGWFHPVRLFHRAQELGQDLGSQDA
jgi:cytochrome c